MKYNVKELMKRYKHIRASNFEELGWKEEGQRDSQILYALNNEMQRKANELYNAYVERLTATIN